MYTIVINLCIFVQPLKTMAEQTEVKQELESLLKHITSGLKNHSIKELNAALVEVLAKKGINTQEKHWIIDEVSKEYGITRHVLINSNEYGMVTTARKLAYCLLHDLLGLSQRHIALNIFKKTPRIVHLAIDYYRNINIEIDEDKIFKDRFEKINLKFIEYINQKTK